MSDSDRRSEVAELAAQLRLRLLHLRQSGVVYVPQQQRPTAASAGREAAAPAPPSSATNDVRVQAQQWSSAQKLEYLRQRNIGDCKRCLLCRNRTHIVFGTGSPEARLMLVGEAPGADEDRLGEPFVGRAGQRLNEWLAAVGLSRHEVYIANVLKCRPPGNRDPEPGEIERCSPFLRAQIRAIMPRAIVALGRHAGMVLSGREDLPLHALRRSQNHYFDAQANLRVPLFVTYHPAYVLRRESGDRGSAGEPHASASDPNELVISDLRRAIELIA